jgi:hypothetical protein
VSIGTMVFVDSKGRIQSVDRPGVASTTIQAQLAELR